MHQLVERSCGVLGQRPVHIQHAYYAPFYKHADQIKDMTVPMMENKIGLIDQLFVSDIIIVRFLLVHCSFDMNCDCLRSLKLQ